MLERMATVFETKGSQVSYKKFAEDILNGMYDWVRVLDRDGNILFANHAMTEGLKTPLVGRKCYEVMGKKSPCDVCISRNTVFTGISQEKEEIIGERIFSVMSSPIRDVDDKIIAVVEVLRDITDAKRMQAHIIGQNKKLQNDLAIAKKLQCSLLPRELPLEDINFSFIYKPCEELGGDFLDIYRIDEDHIGLYIADVSGHGVSASMLTVFLRSAINKKLVSSAEVLNELYQKFNEAGFENEVYITVFYMVLDTKSSSLTYCNAGHNMPPIVYNTRGHHYLDASGIPISNWLVKPYYTDETLDIAKGDRLLIYTDGLIEIRNEHREPFGSERLMEFIKKDHQNIDDSLGTLLQRVCDFTGLEDISGIPDDITIAMLELK